MQGASGVLLGGARDAKGCSKLFSPPGIPPCRAAATPERQAQLPPFGRKGNTVRCLAVGLARRTDVVLHAEGDGHHPASVQVKGVAVRGVAAVVAKVRPISALPAAAVLLRDASKLVQLHDAGRAVAVGAILVAGGLLDQIGVIRGPRVAGAEATSHQIALVVPKAVRIRRLLGALLRPPEVGAESVDGEPIVRIVVPEPGVPLVLHAHIASVRLDGLLLASVGCHPRVIGYEGAKVDIVHQGVGG
mmetsp:Transcript_44482/g.132792  ORF Transcript_44482/g.132792 Transcript_44482/m.132792 type:complete len:246 (-) Transcript_44482:301-1038(-)